MYFWQGIHCGYLQKASMKDPNVWRKRWFVLKDDQLLYCKANTDQRDITSISLLNAYLAKARPELRVPFAFELRTPRRVYQVRLHLYRVSCLTNVLQSCVRPANRTCYRGSMRFMCKLESLLRIIDYIRRRFSSRTMYEIVKDFSMNR